MCAFYRKTRLYVIYKMFSYDILDDKTKLFYFKISDFVIELVSCSKRHIYLHACMLMALWGACASTAPLKFFYKLVYVYKENSIISFGKKWVNKVLSS